MHIGHVLASITYSIGQSTLGLFLHPYQTMQHLVETKVFVWLTFLPIVFQGLFILLWWAALKAFFMEFPMIGVWAFALIWANAFFIFWQVLLLYLLVRFWISLSPKRK